MEAPKQEAKPELRKVPRCVFCGKYLEPEQATWCSRSCKARDRHPY
jgi:hypothetical protein